MQALEHALTDFAGELSVAQSRMVRARQVATAGGVSVADTRISRPVAPDAPTQGEVDAFNRRADAWIEAVEIVDGRAKEQEAHQDLADGIAASTGDGWLQDPDGATSARRWRSSHLDHRWRGGAPRRHTKSVAGRRRTP